MYEASLATYSEGMQHKSAVSSCVIVASFLIDKGHSKDHANNAMLM